MLFLKEKIKDIIIIFTGMMQDGLQTVGPLGGGGGMPPPTSHASLAPPEFERLASGLSYYRPGTGCKSLHFFSPVQTGLSRELAKLITHASQPGLVSPAVEIRLNGTVASGEPLIRVWGKSSHVACYPAECVGGSRP